MKWGLSVLDWRSHLIDERSDHPIGVLIAQCGHRLMVITTLHDAPNGKRCDQCAAPRHSGAAMTTRTAAADPGTREP